MLRRFVFKAKSFEAEAHKILGTHESTVSRVILLERTYQKIARLNVIQDELLRESLRCMENKLFRASHVMAWSGFMDFLENCLIPLHLGDIQKVRPGFKIKTLEDFREKYSDYQIIALAREIHLTSRTEMKALHGLLNKRNECAHPSNYFPDLNQSLGYVSEVINRISTIRARTKIT